MTLEDRHLRVAVGTWPPWCTYTIQEDGSITVIGMAVDIFETILNKMNYSYTYVITGDKEWGRLLPNGTWTGLVGLTVYGKADAALGPFGVTYVRSQAIDYTVPLYFDHHSIFLPKPIAEKDLTNPSKPFSGEVWLALAVVFCASVVIGLLLNHLRKIFAIEESLGNPLETATFKPTWIFSNLLNEPATILPKSATGQMFLGTWLIAAFIVDTAYVGILTSILAVPKVITPVNSLEDLVSYGKIPWFLQEGTSIHQIMEDAKEGLYKEVNDRKAGLVHSCYIDREMVRTERIAIICDTLAMRKAMHDDFSAFGGCYYHMAKNPLFAVSIAYVFPKGSPLTTEFDKWLNALIEGGLVNRQVLESTSNATHCLNRKGQDQVNPILVFMDLAGIFLVWFAGLLLGLISLIAEISVSKLNRSRVNSTSTLRNQN